MCVVYVHTRTMDQDQGNPFTCRKSDFRISRDLYLKPREAVVCSTRAFFPQFPLLRAGVESGRGPAVIPKIKFLTTEVP